MSADNWTTCPRCEANAAKEKAALWQQAEKAYGKATEAEYLRLTREAGEAFELPDSLREDYEIGLSDGKFYVDYRCQCGECGFEFRYRHEERLPPAGPVAGDGDT